MAVEIGDSVERFSLLLLEDGEVLLDDVAVDYDFQLSGVAGSETPSDAFHEVIHKLPSHGHAEKVRGRLKIGSYNIFFDADDWRIPVLRVPIAAIRLATTATIQQMPFSPENGRVSAEDIPKNQPPSVSNEAEHSKQSVLSLADMVKRFVLRQDSSFDPPEATTKSEPSVHDVLAPGSKSEEYSNIATQSVLALASERVCLQRELGVDHPYRFLALCGTHHFYPIYTTAIELLDLIQWLQSVNALPSRKQRIVALQNAIHARENIPFDISLLTHGIGEVVLVDEPCAAIYTLSTAPGRLCVTRSAIYFMPIHGRSGGRVTHIPLSNVRSLRKLRHGILDAALELGYNESMETDPSTPRRMPSRTLMLSFKAHKFREETVSCIHRLVAPGKLVTYDRLELEVALNAWRAGDMSNFEYLMYLNLSGGRSFNDLSQYPVFPWVIADFSSKKLDLSSPSTYRDLTLPIGALNPSRLSMLKERYNEMPSPKFYYGTHYSTPAYVIYYLIRAVPGAMLRLQNGTFDVPDRLFNSVADTWRGVNLNSSDVKELIPEFYAIAADEIPSGILPNLAPGEFLDNILGLDLGIRQDGRRVSDVELPPWADGSSDVFIRMHREALESAYVSSHIHAWNDLIFGVKARNGDVCNLFYTEVAIGNLDGENFERDLDLDRVMQLETVFLEFGRTPDQLFYHPHPPRFGAMEAVDNANEVEPSPWHTSQLNLETDQSGDESEHSSITAVNLCRIDSPPTSNIWDTSSIPGPRSRRTSSSLSPSCSFIESLRTDRKGIPCLHMIDPFERELCAGLVLNLDMAVITSPLLDPEVRELSLTVVSACSDGYLRVHTGLELRRSRYIDGVTTVTFGEDTVVFVGKSSGSIAAYDIATGRVEDICSGAHEGAITAIHFVVEERLLVSASVDAGVKVWRIERTNAQLFPSLCRLHDLDAEDAVYNLSVDLESEHLYVAVMTQSGKVFGWCIDIGFDALNRAGLEYPRPCFELYFPQSDYSDGLHYVADRLMEQRICWVDSAPRRRSLAVLIASEIGTDKFRVWFLDDPGMPIAEVALPMGYANCICRGTQRGSVLLAGANGHVVEYDRTGYALAQTTVPFSNGSEGAVTYIKAFPSWSAALLRVGTGAIAVWR